MKVVVVVVVLRRKEDNGRNVGWILIKYHYMFTSSIYFSLKFHDVNYFCSWTVILFSHSTRGDSLTEFHILEKKSWVLFHSTYFTFHFAGQWTIPYTISMILQLQMSGWVKGKENFIWISRIWYTVTHNKSHGLLKKKTLVIYISILIACSCHIHLGLLNC